MPNEVPPSNPTGEDFGSVLEKFEQEQKIFHTGDLAEGKIGGVSERGVIIDFGFKSEGIAPTEDFVLSTGEIAIKKGDDIEVIIKSLTASGDSPPILSYTDALRSRS